MDHSHLTHLPDDPLTDAPPVVEVDLCQLLKEWTLEHVEPLPRRQTKATHISALPAELLMLILKHLIEWDVVALETLSLCCRSFYMRSRDAEVWRYAQRIYTPYLVHQLDGLQDERMRFLDAPRVRWDGVYIAKCHYVRQGATDFGFFAPVHLVTYYRYLRFYKDQSVLSLLTAIEPKHVVHQLTKYNIHQPASSGDRSSRILVGKHTLTDRLLHIVVRGDGNRAHRLFHMALQVGHGVSADRGAWNRLRWLDYYSICSREGEGMRLDGERVEAELFNEGGDREDENDLIRYELTQFKSFYFSRVRRYLHE